MAVYWTKQGYPKVTYCSVISLNSGLYRRFGGYTVPSPTLGRIYGFNFLAYIRTTIRNFVHISSMPMRKLRELKMIDYPNRTYCDTLAEMRKLIKTTNIFTYKRTIKIIGALVEECQTYGNRMEAGLEYTSDLNHLHSKRKELRKEVKKLKSQKRELEGKENNADL